MRKVLQFSGGKDSLACLELLRDQWHELLVLWVNAGAAYPETIELMERVRATVPHFMEVRGDQPGFVAKFGYPADVVPWHTTSLGRALDGSSGEVFVPYTACCNASLWEPMQRALKEVGAETVYRGQKRCDARKAPIQHGDVIDGITYLFPLYDWTDEDVKAYLGERLPTYYATERTSRDCWNCTAYLDESGPRIAALPERQRAFVLGKLGALLAETDRCRASLATIVGASKC